METISERLSSVQMQLGDSDVGLDIADIKVSMEYLDKFGDYVKNVDKLNSMINEFKGCVAMSRASMSETKDLAAQLAADLAVELDAMRKVIHDNCEKKSRKKCKCVKKVPKIP